MTNLHWEILDKKRLSLLPRLTVFKDDFYLAGGTALALFLGHRDSVDFDFFSPQGFDNAQLTELIVRTFQGLPIEEKMSQKNTISLTVDGMDMSFFKLDSSMLEPFVETEHLNMASVSDIGCMKLNAILGRSVIKDYTDLYVICKNVLPLPELLQKARNKYPTVNSGAFIRALGYYGDVEPGKIMFKNNFYVDIKTIESFFKREIKKIVGLEAT